MSREKSRRSSDGDEIAFPAHTGHSVKAQLMTGQSPY